MIVLKIIFWILVGLLGIITVICLLPVDVLLRSNGADGLQLSYRIPGTPFDSSKEEKKEKKISIAKLLRKTLGLSHLETMDEMRSTIQNQGFSVTLKETVETLLQLLDRVLWILKHCRVPYCTVTAVSAGEDAALDYGIACATIYPLAGYLQEQMKLPARRLKMDLRCDYAREDGVFELDLAVRVRLFHVFRALLHIIKENVEKNLNEVS